VVRKTSFNLGWMRKPAYLLAAPQGFEPRYADPESAVLPLNEGAAICVAWMRVQQRTLDCMGALFERQ
jgi:hypothetical protein